MPKAETHCYRIDSSEVVPLYRVVTPHNYFTVYILSAGR